MTKNYIFLIILSLTLTNPAHSLVNGELIQATGQGCHREDGLGAIFGIKFKGYQGVITGVGIHIGDGVLLTAHHVAHYMDHASVTIFDIEKKMMGGVSGIKPIQEFKRLSPKPTQTKKDMHGTLIQIPDLALFIPPKTIRDEIKECPTLKISTSALKTFKQTYGAVGWGQEGFDGSSISGNFKIGKIILIEKQTNQNEYLSYWDPSYDVSFVTPRRGDSGGPLLGNSENGELQVMGIASFAITSKDHNKKVEYALGKYARLDNLEVKKWLLSTLKN